MAGAERSETGTQTVETIKRIIASAKVCMASNSVMDWPLSNISLSDQWLDDNGTIWLTYIKTSDASLVLDNGRMELFYANAEKGEFLTLSGNASLASYRDLPRHSSIPFSKTLDNTALSSAVGIVRFVPSEAYCWSDEAGKTIPIIIPQSQTA